MASPRSAFGTFLVEPSRLSQAEKVGLLEQTEETLAHGHIDPYVADWFAAAIHRVRTEGCTLDEALGLKPQQGSHDTPVNVTRMRARDSLLVRLSVAVGSDAEALRVLHGKATCPARAMSLLDELRAHRLPRNGGTFTRARQRLAAHRR